MHIVCPHCQGAIELVQLPPSGDVSCPSCGSGFHVETGTTTTVDLTRESLGRFELIQMLGVGAFGMVYKARDPQLDRLVAIKVPRSRHFVNDDERDRFLREARSAAGLRHPAIVPVHEATVRLSASP